MQRDPIQRTAELAAEGRAFVVITVVRSDGSAPRKAGAKLVLEEGGAFAGTIGGGAVEHALLSRRAEWAALLFIVLGGAVLRLAGIGAESADLEEYACIGALRTRGLHHFLIEQRALYPYGAPLAPLL